MGGFGGCGGDGSKATKSSGTFQLRSKSNVTNATAAAAMRYDKTTNVLTPKSRQNVERMNKLISDLT